MEKRERVKNRLSSVLKAARGAGPRFDWVLSVGLGLAAFALYLAARNVFYSYDALGYAEAVESAPFAQLLHPHHVLYDPLCRAALACVRHLGFAGRPLGPMHFVSAAAGGLGAASLYMLSRTLGAGRAAALLAGAALATAACYWRDAASVGVYVPAAAAALAALYVAAKVPAGGAKTAALGGGVLAVAALCHQINFLLLPAAIIYVLTAGTARGKKTVVLLTAYVAVVALAYVAAPAALIRFKTPGSYLDWFFFYARMNRWGGLSPRNALGAADGLARVFYVNTFWDNFAAPFAKGNARHLRVALPLWLAVFVCGTNLTLWFVRGPARRGLLLLGVTFLTYAAFISWWLPNHVEYWLVPAACLLAAVTVAVSARRRWYLVSLVALALAWLGVTNVNWRDGIKPQTRLEANADYRAGLALGGTIPEDALAFLSNSPAITHARYFGGLRRAQSPNWVVNRWRGDGERAARVIEEMVRGELKRGRPVYFGGDAFHDLGGPPVRDLGERLLARGRPVGSYAGAGAGETVYVLMPADADF